MDGERIQQLTAARAEELPGAYVDHPFGPEWDVFRVADKVFMLHVVLDGEPIVNLKAAPEDGAALQRAYEQVRPGYHMNKRHWVSLFGGDELDEALIRDLVTESYLLVVEKLPRSRRPVDPEAFAAGAFDS